MLKLAREHWAREFGMARKKPAEQRIDAGRPKKRKDSGCTEVSVIKRRRRDVERLVKDVASDECEELGFEAMTGWTASHEKERLFQVTKERKRKVQARIEGVLCTAELDDEIEQDLAKRQLADEKNRKIRVAAMKKGIAKMTHTPLDKLTMRGMTMFVESSVKTPALLRQAESLLLRVVSDRMEAARDKHCSPS